jgi:hypothetical protein
VQISLGAVWRVANQHRTDRWCQLQVFQKTASACRIETRRGFPQRVADLRRVRINAASTVFVMQPHSNTLVSPKGQEVGRIATPTELNAIKIATALHVSAMTGHRMDQTLVIQDSNTGAKEIGYMEKFEKCDTWAD